MPVPNPVALLGLLAWFLGIGVAILGSAIFVIIRLAEGRPLLPRVARRAVPWGAASILGVMVLYVALELFVVAGASLLRPAALRADGPVGAKAERPPVPGPEPKIVPEVDKAIQEAGALPLWELLLLNAMFQGSLILLVPLALRASSGASFADLGVGSVGSPWDILRGAMLCFLLLPGVYAASFLAQMLWKAKIHPAAQALFTDLSGPTVVVTVVAAVVIAPVAEEMLFRGVLLAWLWKVAARIQGAIVGGKPEIAMPDETTIVLDPEMFGIPDDSGTLFAMPPASPPAFKPLADWAANVVVSVIFAGMHYKQWPAPVPLFLLSLGLGEAFRRTGSLLAPIALHATFNGLSTTAMILISASGLKVPG